MNDKHQKAIDQLLKDLKERSKELTCLYTIEELLNNPDLPFETLFRKIIKIIPEGWQFPEITEVEIQYEGDTYISEGFSESQHFQIAPVKIQGIEKGFVKVSYREKIFHGSRTDFLEEEQKLLNTIADRISHYILHKNMKEVFNDLKQMEKKLVQKNINETSVIINMLKRSDQKLLIYISRKMLYYLAWNGVERAKSILKEFSETKQSDTIYTSEESNKPSRKKTINTMLHLSESIFRLAQENMPETQIIDFIHKWIDEEKSSFFIKVLETPASSFPEVIEAISKFRFLEKEGVRLSKSIEKGLRVSLIRHFFSDQMEFINIAKEHLTVEDYFEISKRVILTKDSKGKLGGKSAGLFLAESILKKDKNNREIFDSIKIPKTWFISSDGLMSFLRYNNLEGIIDQKYKDIDEIHIEYPNIIQIFKNSHFPPEIMQGLLTVLEDFGDKPIIVRSSSLLEDRVGSAFSGKYKSLFLANQGTKQERLEALEDAIAEVYASVFGPDPIEYRTERGLLDFHEEMGIMIQEVVGTQTGPYYMPTFAGVAFSRNEFRWSPRIKSEDGLIRMVPGLGTRAVDRVSEDYPTLISPGKPTLRTNISPEEVLRYSTKKIDVIDLNTNSFCTIDFDALIKSNGSQINGVENLVSIYDRNMIRNPASRFGIDFDNQKLVPTFDGLIKNTVFIKKIKALLETLSDAFNGPVDLEFAQNGDDLYLLQCRPQSFSNETAPVPIPQDVDERRILFKAGKHISNGLITNITHLVYIDPAAYSSLSKLEDLKSVGRAVGRLNRILPRHQFVLMGPGRWGSRGDIKLGVSITYSDINNTSALIEIAMKKGDYTPELSFGTHFFQDLVEEGIRYIPIYPSHSGTIFNIDILSNSRNILDDILPEFSFLSDVIKVVDIPESFNNNNLKIVMNSDEVQALAFLTENLENTSSRNEEPIFVPASSDSHWRWRKHMAETIAAELDPVKFDVKGFYLFGSTKNATAGPCSDIDLIIHRGDSESKLKELQIWLEGWNSCLVQMNHLKTGFNTKQILDIHYITDEDIRKKTSFAIKIGAITDAALPLKMNVSDQRAK